MYLEESLGNSADSGTFPAKLIYQAPQMLSQFSD